MATYPRGKPTSPARPGKMIKEVLLAKRPLVTGELVEEAAIVDIHNVYRDFIYEQNQTRKQESKLKGMTYPSFLKLFKFAQLLNLVELVREEPMLFPPPQGHLYSVRRRVGDTRVFAVISKRRVFRLTSLGTEDDLSWTDLCRAWREKWPAPQKVVELVVEEVPVVEAPPPKPKRIRKTLAEVEAEKAKEALVPTLKLQIKPTKEQYVLLLDHLHKLNAIGIDNKRVQKEIDKLANMVGEWVAEAIESLQDAQDFGIPAKVIEFRHLRNVLTEVDEGLLDRDIPRAIESLSKLA